MMSCIVIFHLLFATISGHSLKSFSLVEKLFQDPVAFASTFEKANPEAVHSVLDLVYSLIAEGQDKKATIIAEHEDAIVATADRAAELATALYELEDAAGERVESDEEVDRLKDVLAELVAAEKAASDAKSVCSGVLDDAQLWMTAEVERVDSERVSLEEVNDILASLPSSRRLLSNLPSTLIPLGMLSLAKTDPSIVAELVELVKELIAAGETVRLTVTQARDDAQTDLSSKTSVWEAAVQATAEGEDNLADGVSDAAAKLLVQQAKRQVFDTATADHDAAVVFEAGKKDVRDTQVPILDHEDDQLHQVVVILEGLLPEE